VLLANSKSIRQICKPWQLDFQVLLELANRLLYFLPKYKRTRDDILIILGILDPCCYPRGYCEGFPSFIFSFRFSFAELNVTRREEGS